MTIGDRIRARRIELGMTQQDLAELIGYKGKTAVSKIEAGERELRQSKIKLVADALNTSVEYIMGWEDALKTLAKQKVEEDKLLGYFRQLNSEGKIQALSMVKSLSEMEPFREKNGESSEKIDTA